MYQELVKMIQNLIDKKNLNANVYFDDDYSKVLVVAPRARAEIFSGKLDITDGRNTLSYNLPSHPEEVFKLFLKHFSSNLATFFSKVSNSYGVQEISDKQFINSMSLMMRDKGYHMSKGERLNQKGRFFKFNFYNKDSLTTNYENLEIIARIPQKCNSNSFAMRTRQIKKLNSNKVLSKKGASFRATIPNSKLILSGKGILL